MGNYYEKKRSLGPLPALKMRPSVVYVHTFVRSTQGNGDGGNSGATHNTTPHHLLVYMYRGLVWRIDPRIHYGGSARPDKTRVRSLGYGH